MTTTRQTEFQIHTPLAFFEKAGAPEGTGRRIGGLISTDTIDRQGEIVLQEGLDFSEFLKHGWYNDNHSKSQTDVVGYPDSVKYVRKGETLPDGTVAPANGHWAEGYLLDTGNDNDTASKIWRIGKSLSRLPGNRRLGFSIEGKVLARAGDSRKIIAKAVVTNTAVTHCPVNTDTGLVALVKSLVTQGVETAPRADADQMWRDANLHVTAPEILIEESGVTWKDDSGTRVRALVNGQPSFARVVPASFFERALDSTAAAPLRPESLERDKPKPAQSTPPASARKLTKAEAIAEVGRRFPQLPYKALETIVESVQRISAH